MDTTVVVTIFFTSAAAVGILVLYLIASKKK